LFLAPNGLVVGDVAGRVFVQKWSVFGPHYVAVMGSVLCDYSRRDPQARQNGCQRLAPLVAAFRPRRGKMILGGVFSFMVLRLAVGFAKSKSLTVAPVSRHHHWAEPDIAGQVLNSPGLRSSGTGRRRRVFT